MKQEREEFAKAEERNKKGRVRVAGEETAIRRQIRDWLSLVGEDGIDAAVRTARKRHHPDAGENHNDFVTLTKLTDWMKTELKKKQLGFFVI